jgi:hypothetical protein
MAASGSHTLSIHFSIDFVQEELGMWRWIEIQDDGSRCCSREAYSNLNDCVKDARRHIAFARLHFDLPTRHHGISGTADSQ